MYTDSTVLKAHSENCLDNGRHSCKYFQLQNRRYLGNKYKLLGFIEDVVSEKCGSVTSLCDIFAGTGAVSERFNSLGVKIISNDFLFSNYVCLKAFYRLRDFLVVLQKLEELEWNRENQERYQILLIQNRVYGYGEQQFYRL